MTIELEFSFGVRRQPIFKYLCCLRLLACLEIVELDCVERESTLESTRHEVMVQDSDG